MKVHTTNYFNTFIEVADDTKATNGTIPPAKAKKSIAEMQFELLAGNPYSYTSDDILFLIFANKNDVNVEDRDAAREQFFSKGQPCFRASPLTKTYGFGIHYDEMGKMAIYGMETNEYATFLIDNKIKKIKAMKSNKL